MTAESPIADRRDQLLKEKAALLFRREQQLVELRNASERVESWMGVFHALSELLGVIDTDEIMSRAEAMLVDLLGFEAVVVFRHDPPREELVPVSAMPATHAGVPIVLSGRDDPLLGPRQGADEETAGEGDERVGTAAGLTKYFWLTFPVGTIQHLLAVGFSAASAPYHSLSVSDAGHFIMFGYHLAALLNNAELAEQVRQERAELRLAQKLEAVGQLAAGIAHEINTPMQYIGDNLAFLTKTFDRIAPISDRLQELSSQGSMEERRAGIDSLLGEFEQSGMALFLARVPRSLENAQEGVSAVARIVRAMKDFSHPGGDEKEPVDLNHAVDASVTVSRNEWKYVAEVDFVPDDTLPAVMALPGEINQVLLNLIVNAGHAIGDRWGDSDERGTIRISTSHDEEFAEVRVSDNGTGMSNDILDKIFTPFFTTKEVGRGTGQGLSITRNVVVDKHKGQLLVESELGVGSTFIVRLPLVA